MFVKEDLKVTPFLSHHSPESALYEDVEYGSDSQYKHFFFHLDENLKRDLRPFFWVFGSSSVDWIEGNILSHKFPPRFCEYSIKADRSRESDGNGAKRDNLINRLLHAPTGQGRTAEPDKKGKENLDIMAVFRKVIKDVTGSSHFWQSNFN